MDSASLDSLSDTSTLPELSFEDLLDQSPIKKLPESLFENDVLEETSKTENDETLNTPIVNRKLQLSKSNQATSSDELAEMLTLTGTSRNTMETSNEQKKTNTLCTPTPPTTPKTTQSIIAAASAKTIPTSAAASVSKSDASASASTPVLLNSKIALSKTNITPQTIVKIATNQKTISTSSNSATIPTSISTSTTAKTALGTVTTIDGKTALKTASGQIVYIHKSQPKTTGIGANASSANGNSGNAPSAVRIKTATTLPVAVVTPTATSTNMTAVKVTPTMSSAVSGSNTKILTTTANIGGNKTVIQLIRSADGKLVPLKTATASGKSTLTLSPTVAAQLAGKKLITTSGGQVVLKTAATAIAAGSLKQTTSTVGNTTAADSLVTTAKPIKIQKIMAPSSTALKATTTTTTTTQPITPATIAANKLVPTATSSETSAATADGLSSTTITTTTQPINVTSTAGGKIYVGTQIVVPSSQLIKLSPKLSGGTTTATVSGTTTNNGNNNAASSSTKISGALHAIHIPGKPGLQYVRVFTAPKKSITTLSTTTTATASTTATTSIAASGKMLNSVPPKFTVVRPSPTSKIILTKSPKSEGSPVLSPVTVGKVKSIVTVPTIRNITSSSDSPSTNSSPVVTSVPISKSTVTLSGTTSSTTTTETTTTTTATNVVSTSGILRPKTKISDINSEIQQLTASTGEEKKVVCGPDGKRYLVMPRSMLRAAQSASSQNRLVSGVSGQQQTNQSQQQQQRSAQQPKVYSVVKTGTSRTGLSPASVSEGGMKSFIICKTAQGGSSIKAIQVKRPVQQTMPQPQSRIFIQPKEEEEEKKLPTITTTTTTASTSKTTTQSNNNKFIPIKIKQEPLDSDDLASLMFSDEALVRGGVRRKHCNCSKSQCLKLYCDCFANGEFCQDCTCKDCFNNLQYEDERQRAIKSCLERNPSAFKPKITTSSDQGDTRLHNKGCNCKRSGCLKNYCECFEAKIPCSSNCKCVGCRNVEDRPDLDMDPIDPKLLESIASASNATNTIARAVITSNQATFAGGIRRTYERAIAKKERRSESDNLDENNQRHGRKRAHSDDDFTGSAALLASPQLGDGMNDDGNLIAEKRSANFITQEVIDATIQCMISQADECLKNSLPAHQIEKMVLEELGRCLVEIIDFSIRNTDTSFSQN